MLDDGCSSQMLPFTSSHYDPKRREWSGPKKKDLYNDAMTLGEVIHKVLSKNPEKIIQINDVTGESMTCQELLINAENLAKYLVMDFDLKVGDVIGLYAGNFTHVVTLILASFFCGTPVNALYQEFDKATVSSIYNVTRPKILFCELENYEIMRCVNDELKLGASIFLLNGSIKEAKNIKDLLQMKPMEDSINFRFPCLSMHGNATAAIVCSSGTTGPPKGVLVSHRALMNLDIFLGITTKSKVFSFSVLYWISGLWTMLGSLINGCQRIITEKPFSPKYLLDLIRRHEITHIASNACQISELALTKDIEKVRKCLASIHSIMAGGAKVPVVTQERMHHILSNNLQRPGLVVAYGISEVGGMISYNGKYLAEHLIGSEGKLAANITIRILNKTGELLGPNEHGEICISMPYPWQGYADNEEATRVALRGNWLHTGDIGYFNDEGFLHLCTRDNDVFKSRNFQIYPQILEDIIMRLKGVAEACVFGVPDLVATHLIACAVVRTSDNDGLNLTKIDITEVVNKNIGAMYHLDGGVYFVNALPQTGSGKVQRYKIYQMIMQQDEI